MSTLFDGMAGILNDALGALVTHTPSGGAARSIRAVFRREPTSTSDDDGREILVMAPTLRVQISDATAIARGDAIDIADGAQYIVLNRQPTRSPAADAFVIFELEETS
jgi:hypothetical protein